MSDGQAAEVDALAANSSPAPHRTPGLWMGLLGEIVAAADPSTEADPVGVLGGLLAGVGVLVGSNPHVRVGNTRHPLTVWPLLFGRTGSGRKGEAGSTASLFLTAAAPEEYRRLTVGGLSSG